MAHRLPAAVGFSGTSSPRSSRNHFSPSSLLPHTAASAFAGAAQNCSDGEDAVQVQPPLHPRADAGEVGQLEPVQGAGQVRRRASTVSPSGFCMSAATFASSTFGPIPIEHRM